MVIKIVLIVGLFIIGAALGSFAMATVWRLRVLQLKNDRDNGIKLSRDDKKLIKTLGSGLFSFNDRSSCLNCGRDLKWFDLMPILSWLFLRGKCRDCKKPIGSCEFFAEIGLGVVFVLSYLFWPLAILDSAVSISLFISWLIILLLLTILLFYDLKWFLLPDKITIILLLFSLIYTVLYIYMIYGDSDVIISHYVYNFIYSLLILPGFYGLLYFVSRGKWVGFGDVKLLLPLAIIVLSWPNSILLIFLANFIGCIVVLPGLLSKKLNRVSRVPFGPFLILAFYITVIWGANIVDMYTSNLLMFNH